MTLVPPKLGKKILLLTDNCPACLQMLQLVVESLPNLQQTRFTLLHCCPTIYWEHSGVVAPEIEDNIEVIREANLNEFRTTEQYFEQAKEILIKAGVPARFIELIRDPDHDSLLSATMAELNNHSYTGVILHSRHKDIISRLERRGITDMFRKVPEVTVWALDNEILEMLAPQSVPKEI